MIIYIYTCPYDKRSSCDYTYSCMNLPTPKGYNFKRTKGSNHQFIEDFLSIQSVNNKLHKILAELLVNEQDEITVCIYCKNGKHRSVAMAILLAQELHNLGHDVYINNL